jgi:hypothetical protein
MIESRYMVGAGYISTYLLSKLGTFHVPRLHRVLRVLRVPRFFVGIDRGKLLQY